VEHEASLLQGVGNTGNTIGLAKTFPWSMAACGVCWIALFITLARMMESSNGSRREGEAEIEEERTKVGREESTCRVDQEILEGQFPNPHSSRGRKDMAARYLKGRKGQVNFLARSPCTDKIENDTVDTLKGKNKFC
jgi:hypothetical protein